MQFRRASRRWDSSISKIRILDSENTIVRLECFEGRVVHSVGVAIENNVPPVALEAAE